jgi:class 3 adenylate cyclase/tetratricopeptide (TPR) repeat protein
MGAMAAELGSLPSGRVTFSFTDVVGSTRALITHGDRFVEALRESHSAIGRLACLHGGVVVKTEGDGAFLAFSSAEDAVTCLRDIQEHHEEAGSSVGFRLRAGLHTGDAVVIDHDYISLAVHVAARISAAAGAGQVLASGTVIDELPHPQGERIGEFELKDIPEPVTLWRLVGDSSPPQAVPVRRTNVAVPHTSFVGRDEEFAEAEKLLAVPGLVSVVGPGGVGKTRLVSEVALRQAQRRAGGAWLVELASIQRGSEIVNAVAAAMGMRRQVSPELVIGELNRRGSVIVVLDNCEHVIEDAAGFAQRLVGDCPALSLLATSRERLGVEAERVLKLRPFSDPAAIHGPAARLFLDRAAAASGSLVADDRAVGELCELLDGLPLALELAAARSPDLPLASLVSAIRSGGLMLKRRGGEARQRSLEALVAWSVDALDDRARDALLALSVLPAGFDMAEAEAVAGPIIGNNDRGLVVAVLSGLVRRSLLDLDGDRYRMLFPVRSVISKQLMQRPERARQAHEGLFAYCLRHLTGDPVQITAQAVAYSDDELLTFETALEWGVAHRVEGVGQLFHGMVVASHAHPIGDRLRYLAASVLRDAETVKTVDDVLLVASALSRCVGAAAAVRSEVPWPIEKGHWLVGRAQDIGDPYALGYALTVVSRLLQTTGALEETLALLQMARSAFSRHESSRYWDFQIVNQVGIAHHLAGALVAAEEEYSEALNVAEELNLAEQIQWASANLGEVRLDMGDPERAIAPLAKGSRVADGSRVPATVLLGLLAEALSEVGQRDEAVPLARSAEASLKKVVAGDPSEHYYLDRLQQRVLTLPDD